MRTFLFPLALFAALGCATQHGGSSSAPNNWGDNGLWAVLEAQDHRNTQGLCALLGDSSVAVREAAALAFASVQDSASVPCLLKALADPSSSVRSNAVLALAFVADSSTVERMAEAAVSERDTMVQRAYLSASFIAMQRNGLLKDPNAILYYFDHAGGHELVRAADALRRLPDSLLKAIATEYMTLFPSETPIESEAVLVKGLGKVGSPEALKLLRFSADPDKPAVIIPNALRTLGGLQDPADDSLLFYWVGPGCIGQAALEALAGREILSAEQCLRAALEESDARTRTMLLGLAMKHGEETTRDSARAQLEALGRTVDHNPYLNAERVRALAMALRDGDFDTFMGMMTHDEPAAVRQAAFEGAVQVVRGIMMRSRYASREAQYAQLGEVMRAALNTGDAGLISAAAEALTSEEPDVLRIILDTTTQEKALSALLPIRDLEARMLLEQVIAKRDDLPAPTPQRTAFNHPIDKARLLALKQGQQYRITTNKGVIIIATDVNECPGSSLAFDSLVTSGYYNGKAFHRVVPNFVAQGGCPRGDGYGGMPWTLRTEIGRTPFTAGSVGLASAGPDTESCQFFITHSAAPHLDGRYTRFGAVVSGMDVVWLLQVGDVMTRVERVE